MPTVFRFLTILAALAAAIYGAMFLLVTFVEPRQSEMTVDVPIDHIKPLPAQTGSTPGERAPPVRGPAEPPAQ